MTGSTYLIYISVGAIMVICWSTFSRQKCNPVGLDGS